MGLVSILQSRSQRLTTSCGALVDWETKTVCTTKKKAYRHRSRTERGTSTVECEKKGRTQIPKPRTASVN